MRMMMKGAVFFIACHVAVAYVSCYQLGASAWLPSDLNLRTRTPATFWSAQPHTNNLASLSCADVQSPRQRQPEAARIIARFIQASATPPRSGVDAGEVQSRRSFVGLLAAAGLGVGKSAWAQSAVVQKSDPLPEGAKQPTDNEIRDVQKAIEAYNNKELEKAEKLFSSSIDVWERNLRPRDEKAELYKFRANARVDLKRFEEALVDYNAVLNLMNDGENPDGTARYMEYPDTYVQRGLCYEGLYRWDDAVKDYDRAVKLWGGGRGQGVNPYVLTFRANALTQLGRYKDSLADYAAAETLFTQRRDQERALDSRANYALALYETGDRVQAYKIMQDIVRRRQGYTDMHVALAAVEWGEGRVEEAESQWQTACDRISTGCRKYKDANWVTTVRRWPPTMANLLQSFLAMKEAPKGEPLQIPLPTLPSIPGLPTPPSSST